ncbi:hypothetical protein H6G96_37210 [Nostoc sp. FACHB-892]|uniref:hypothetical protein n=1 Tax=Nostoc sp. FACHB-892 TaxID=2692843 RepID=UPI001685851F|nr:hypothetical protein [Nostoc sp. FACHB-892]MBD2731765.1 hypothetical protein [Nostoc sp. FACHB-892]
MATQRSHHYSLNFHPLNFSGDLLNWLGQSYGWRSPLDVGEAIVVRCAGGVAHGNHKSYAYWKF